jgi:NAD(P)-dependent dehydrogenase (short-subunit alcohol dehydrogenase family)
VPAPRTCLVTGASQGLGREIARQLADQGHFVFLACRDEASAKLAVRELQAQDLHVAGVPLDVTQTDSIDAAVRTVEAQAGRLDVLVNNAGILIRSGKPVSETPIADVRRILETNLLGSVAVTQAFLPLLRRSDAGRIVNVSSGLGSIAQSADPHYEYAAYKNLGYCLSKSALNAATVLFAAELAGTPIKVNAADPGHCATGLNGFTGSRSAVQGAAIAVRLATLPPEGPSGGFFDDHGRVPW